MCAYKCRICKLVTELPSEDDTPCVASDHVWVAVKSDESGGRAWQNQVGGEHYHTPGSIQPFAYAMANKLNALEFSVVKYLRHKGNKTQRLEDLRKARDCLDKLIEWEEKDGNV